MNFVPKMNQKSPTSICGSKSFFGSLTLAMTGGERTGGEGRGRGARTGEGEKRGGNGTEAGMDGIKDWTPPNFERN